jgi:hypothetical protein
MDLGERKMTSLTPLVILLGLIGVAVNIYGIISLDRDMKRRLSDKIERETGDADDCSAP